LHTSTQETELKGATTRDEGIRKAVDSVLRYPKSDQLAIFNLDSVSGIPVGQAILQDSRVVDYYGTQRYQIPCQNVHSPAMLANVIAAGLAIHTSTNSSMKDLASTLQAKGQARIILLDNVNSSFFIRNKQSDVEEVFKTVASSPNTSLLVNISSEGD
jgi:hypothetical protein